MINYANNFRYSAHRVYSDDLGAAIVLFVLIKFLGRPKNKKDSFIIKNVHIITGDGTDITAERKDGFIHMTGTFKGKPQDKTFRIADGLWYQTMDMAIPAFIASAQAEIIFYSIGTGNNRGTMGLG